MPDENPTLSSPSEQQVSSYLFLHLSENPATSLVFLFLDSTNYHSWRQSIIPVLSSKKKSWIHSCPPKDNRTFSTWSHCNNMVVSWLVHFVSVPIRQSVIGMDVTLDIWNNLKIKYSQGDLSRISNLQLEGASLDQGDLSVTCYFTKLRIIGKFHM